MKDNWRRFLVLILSAILLGGVLVLCLEDRQVVSQGLATYYVTQALPQTGAVNAVTGIYLNYRVFDTIFEAVLLAVSVMASIYLSWRKEDDE